MPAEALPIETNLGVGRLRQTLSSCSKLIEAGNINESEQQLSELVDFLSSLSESAVREPGNEAAEGTAFEIVFEIHRYISSSSLDEAVIDALSFELPKAVAKFACASKRCAEVAQNVIDRLVEICNPRDMLSILCEALGSPNDLFRVPQYFGPLLRAIAKVLISIRRRHIEQLKAAFPVILNVLKAVALESDDEDTDCADLFCTVIDLANSTYAISLKLEGEENKQIRALFGLFILQSMALVTIGMRNNISSCLPLVLQLTYFLRHCNLSYIGLITGHDANMISHIALLDDEDDQMSCFSHIKHGSSLAVIWGYKSNEIALAIEADFIAVKGELHNDQNKRWEAVGMLKHIFSSVNLPWELKKHAIGFLLNIIYEKASLGSEDEDGECSMYMPTLYASLQAIQMVIMYAPDAGLRKQAFEAFRRVLADVPTSQRFDILSALVKNSDSSSMIAILLHLIKEEMHAEITQRNSGEVLHRENNNGQSTSSWNAAALELIELILRPSQGGPPNLAEYGDAVLSALNLYRFILITESRGKTNYTGVLFKESLQKAHNEWLLPLRTLVTGIMAENQKDQAQLASGMLCALNPVELVLYRCIELIEENLKNIA